MDLFTRFTINAARRLPKVAAEHVCSRLHGHTFVVEVYVRGAIDPATGWVMDFETLDAVCADVREKLDHRYLNDIKGLENPTTEVLAVWVWHRIVNEVPGLHKILVRENEHQGCVYHGPNGGRLVDQ